MNQFEEQLKKIADESVELQKSELELRAKVGLFNQKLTGFLKEQGLPENWTLPELALLAIRKAKGE